MKKSKRVKKSNSWKIKQHRDQYFKKSKTFGYRSRASFKLIELNENNNKSMFNQNFDFSGKKIWMLVNLELWMREFF